MVEKELKEGLDVIKEIIESQPVGKEIVISIYSVSGSVMLIEIKGDKTYSLVPLEERTRLYINYDNNFKSDNIKLILPSIVYDIKDFILNNIERFNVARHCKKANIVKFVLVR